MGCYAGCSGLWGAIWGAEGYELLWGAEAYGVLCGVQRVMGCYRGAVGYGVPMNCSGRSGAIGLQWVQCSGCCRGARVGGSGSGGAVGWGCHWCGAELWGAPPVPLPEHKRGFGLGVVVAGGGAADEHGGAAVPPQRVLQDARHFAVPVRHVRLLRGHGGTQGRGGDGVGWGCGVGLWVSLCPPPALR